MKENIIFNVGGLSDYLKSTSINYELQTDIVEGVRKNSMALRLSPHVLQLIDWQNVTTDPIRKQFLPLLSEYLPSHPQLRIDSLSEKNSQVAPGILHRYPNKVLFLLGTSCATYCAFCTRSYLVGPNTQALTKDHLFKSSTANIDILINYLEENIHVNDIVVSGGDIAVVDIEIINLLLTKLLTIKSLKTIRLATRTLLFAPSLLLPNTPLFDTIVKHNEKFKHRNIELSIQCHFNHANEISIESQKISISLWQSGVTIRNQTVLLDGVNSTIDAQEKLIRKLIDSNIHPYYVYQMDMVDNAEHFRTNLETCIYISKNLTGMFTGFQLPKFIVDLPDGGGKRSVYEYEFYDKKYGIYGFTSPIISGDKIYYYCDPLRYLDPNIEKEWYQKRSISKLYD